jgi:guanylate kinase
MLKFNRPTLVTLTAPTCSGKNYLRDLIEKKYGWNRIVSTTTRAKRVGEAQGIDYYFISEAESMFLEDEDKFAELINFRGTRYGVTKDEMANKMNQKIPPMVILEVDGLAQYKKLCTENGWDIFTIYISVQESIRIERLAARTVIDIRELADIRAGNSLEKLIAIHNDRMLSITGDERHWSNASSWDLIADGTDGARALTELYTAVAWHNRKNQMPTPYTHVVN